MTVGAEDTSKQDMKRRLANLHLTNQRSAQLRSISVPYIRAFWRGKQQFRNDVDLAWVCAAIIRQTASAHSLLFGTNRNRTPNNHSNACTVVRPTCKDDGKGRANFNSQWHKNLWNFSDLNLTSVISSPRSTPVQIFISIHSVWTSPGMGEILRFCEFFLVILYFFSQACTQVEPVDRSFLV